MSECLYTCVITTEGKCIMTSDGKHVIVGPVIEPGGNFKVQVKPRIIPRDFFYGIKGYKLVPVFYDYDVLFQSIPGFYLDFIRCMFAYFFQPYLLLVLALAGLFDQWIDFRKLRQPAVEDPEDDLE